MRVSKKIVINLGGYQSLHIGCEDVATYGVADEIIRTELERLSIPLEGRIKQCLLPKE